MMLSSPTLYDILGVDETASQSEIRSAYLKIIREVHPDQASPALAHLAQQINDAYSTLKDEASREEYNRSLRGPTQETPTEPAFMEPDFGWGATSTWEQPSPTNTTGTQAPRNQSAFADEGAPTRAPGRSVSVDPAWLQPGGPLHPETIVPTLHSSNRCWKLFSISWIFAAILVIVLISQQFPWWTMVVPIVASVVLFAYAKASSNKTQAILAGARWVALAGLALVGAWLVVGAVHGAKGAGPMPMVLLILSSVPQFLAASWLHEITQADRDSPHAVSIMRGKQRIAGSLTPSLAGARMKLGFDLLAGMASIPGVRLFIGMQFPSTSKATVDFVLVSGKKIALIDTELWKSGTFGWEPDGTLRRTAGTDSHGVVTDMPQAVAAFRSNFPEFEIAAWLLIHPSVETAKVGFGNTQGPGVAIGDAPAVVKSVYQWITTNHTGIVDRRDLARL